MMLEPSARYTGLERLDIPGLAVFSSTSCRTLALPIARRCADARQVLAGILAYLADHPAEAALINASSPSGPLSSSTKRVTRHPH